jgi:hypothetical protein
MGNDLNLGFWGLDEYVTRVTYSSPAWEPVVCDVLGFGFRVLEVDEYVTYSSNI